MAASKWKKVRDGLYVYYVGDRRMGAVFRRDSRWYSWAAADNRTTDWGRLRGKIDLPKRYVEATVHDRVTSKPPAPLLNLFPYKKR